MSKAKQFERYADYYDLIYQKKPYKKELAFLQQAFKKFAGKKVNSLLSLGCGTGVYELMLAKNGYSVTGVDLSAQMLKLARDKARSAGLKIDFRKGDARTFRSNKRYDAAIALFNIAGYQNSNQDFDKFVDTAAKQLKRGGLFGFDCWYQPAVLKDRPRNRTKTILLGRGRKLIRSTKQTLDIESGLLNIEFQIKEYKGGRLLKTVSEKHPMRFFTLNEIRIVLEEKGLELIKACVFPKFSQPVSEKNWDMFILARKL